MNIHRVGVIGAGQMGSGIAHVCALAGFDVALNDVSEERVKAGIATINGNLARQVAKNAISEDERQAALGRIDAGRRRIDGLADCDLVIETAIEKEEVKRKIFADLVPGAQGRARSSPPTPRRSRSPGSPPPPTGRNASSASIS